MTDYLTVQQARTNAGLRLVGIRLLMIECKPVSADGPGFQSRVPL